MKLVAGKRCITAAWRSIDCMHRLLLNYTSRAEVGLLKNGSGGIQEVREAVAQYDEQSPLFGLIHYRRRKVLLKYVPEGTSRLWQGALATMTVKAKLWLAENGI